MANDGIRLEGFRELEQALAELPKATERSVLRRVAIKALGPFVAKAKELAPFDEGDLRDSIAAGTKLTRRAKAAAKRDPVDGVRVFAGTANQNAVPLEFGSMRTAAQPFMRPALDYTQGEIIENVKKDLSAEIDRAAKRLAKKRARQGQ